MTSAAAARQRRGPSEKSSPEASTRPKILFHSNAPFAASGYGKQTRLAAPELIRLGRDVTISAFWGLRGAALNWEGIRILPAALDGHGNDILVEHAKHVFGDAKGGLTIILTDIWVMQPQVLKQLHAAAWVPVDHEPCQPPTVRALRDGDCFPIAMSRFGERMLRDEGFDPLYVPHSVDTEVFAPVDRVKARKLLEVPDGAFLVGMVAANQSHRKSYPASIAAFARLHARHPESILYLHTWLGGELGGLDLLLLLDQNGLPRSAVRTCDRYRYNAGFPDEYLAAAYSAMDVLLNPAMGEGFGVPLIEAQSSGCPVIVSHFSSMPELCGSGWTVGGARVYTDFQSWQITPDPTDLDHALERAWASRGRQELRDEAREFALAYDVRHVTDTYWAPALAELDARVAAREKKEKRAATAATAKAKRRKAGARR